MIKNILLVGLGGGAGSILRYLCQRWFAAVYSHSFPWGTFAVNITGCFLIGIIWGITFRTFDSNEHWKLFLMTGICGGFTTFSAFTLEGIGLLRENKTGLFFLYVAGSVIAGLALTLIGMKLTR
ncbi:MAG TPA: fluoride efflux transporter CrcB [Chitinophagaceae bacterium]|nr:fluoride efflux transporter CrcB [Chitinophagaceae bacterium]